MHRIARNGLVGSLLLLSFVFATASGAAATTSMCGGEALACCLGFTCDAGLICNGSVCVPCGGATEPCCAADACDSGFICTEFAETPPSQTTGGGAAFTNQCVPCGDQNQLCCENSMCNSGLICGQPFTESPPSEGTGSGAISGPALVCIPCGDPGEPCCTGDICAAGAFCEICDVDETAGEGGGATIDCMITESLGGGAQIGQPTLCIACGQPGQPCCPMDECDEGALCDYGTCEACGELDEQCCEMEMCSTGLVCLGPLGEASGSGAGRPMNGLTCVPCGALGDPCCAGSMCNEENLLCDAGLCEQCGDIGEQCCADNTCPDSDAVCQEGICEPLPAAPVMGFVAFAALIMLLGGVGLFHLGRSGGLTARG
jgi:hypothetical protein